MDNRDNSKNKHVFNLEILSDASESEEEIDDDNEADDKYETPPPRLTIGDVLVSLPKLKNGRLIEREFKIKNVKKLVIQSFFL